MGTKNRLLEHGHDLVSISEHLQSCDICKPYQGRTFSLTGRDDVHPLIDKLPPFHPNCRHVLLPAVTTFERMERALGIGPDRVSYQGEIPPPWREHTPSPRFEPLRGPLREEDPFTGELIAEEAHQKEPRAPVLLADEIAGKVAPLDYGETFRTPEGVLIERMGSGRNYRIDGPSGTAYRSSLEEVALVVEAEENIARADRFGPSIPGNPLDPVIGVDVPPKDPIGDRVGGMLHGGTIVLPHGTSVHRRPGEGGDSFVVTSPGGVVRIFPATDKDSTVEAAREFEAKATGVVGGTAGAAAEFTPTATVRDPDGPLQPLSEAFYENRVQMHRISEQVLGYAQEPQTEIVVVQTDKGFGTPPYPEGDGISQIRVEGNELVKVVDGVEVNRERIPFTDRKASEELANVFKVGDRVQHELWTKGKVRDESTAGSYGDPVIWPEHFDMAIEMEGDVSRATYGMSPGDELHPEPYFYVSPWEKQPADPAVWNAKGFAGAELSYAEVLASPDQEKTIRDFYESKLKALGGYIEPDDQDVPVYCGGDIEKAAKLLLKGRKVELGQPREVATLLDRLDEIADYMKLRGDEAPNVNLCDVSVEGTNLFCQDNLGIPRIKMPQLKGVPIPGSKADKLARDDRGEVDVTPAFRQYLLDHGHTIEKATESAETLRASQNELNGVKVAGMAEFLDTGADFDPQAMLVSRDNYIIDGHHRWASKVGHDLEDNVAGDVTMEIERVDEDIGTLLDEARKFARDWGIPEVAVAQFVPTKRHGDGALDVPEPDEERLWTDNAGISNPASPNAFGKAQIVHEAMQEFDAVIRPPEGMPVLNVDVDTPPSYGAEAEFSKNTAALRALEPGNPQYLPWIRFGSGVSRWTVLHELGHYIDRLALTGETPEGREPMQIVSSADSGALRDAIFNSRSLQDLAIPSRRPAGMPQQFVDYLRRPTEAFSRALAQYVATKNGELDSLRADMTRDAAPEIARFYVWDEADFAPIEIAFDRYFEQKGWLKPAVDVGITPFRGKGNAAGIDYYETSRYKGFERRVYEEAHELGLGVEGFEKARGVWAGGGEPAAKIKLRGPAADVSAFMAHLGREFNQDAVIAWHDDPEGPDLRHRTDEPVDVDDETIEEAIALVNTGIPESQKIQGAARGPDGHLEIIDKGKAATVQIRRLAARLDVAFHYSRGSGELRFKGSDY